MNLLFLEALFIGYYVITLYIIFNFFNLNLNFYIELFIIGFIKHFLGYYLGLHEYYCNSGCKNKGDTDIYIVINNDLFIQSIIEGLLFVLLGYIINNFNDNKYYTYFILGFLLHLMGDLLGFHKNFCNNYCYKKK